MPTLWRQNPSLPYGDHQILVTEGQGKKRVVEFGPGASTYAWIEAGVPEIVSLECRDEWREEKAREFADYPNVTVLPFWNNAPTAEVPKDLGVFDLAFVDSPRGQPNPDAVKLPGQMDCNRLNTLYAALLLSDIVLLHDAGRHWERNSLNRLEREGHLIGWYQPGDHRSYGMARVMKNGRKDPARFGLPSAPQPGCAPDRPSA